MLSHSYLSVSDLRSPQYPNSIEFLTKSIEVDTEKSSLFLGKPKLTAYTPSYETSQNHRALWSWQSWQNAHLAHGH